MGMLVNGVWQVKNPENVDGGFVRPDSPYRDVISQDTVSKNPGRFVLYVSLACPWACTVLVVRKLAELESIIEVRYVNPYMGNKGWVLEKPNKETGAKTLHELYTQTNSTFTGKVTVPVLWDTQNKCIVNNESMDLIMMMNNEWSHLVAGDFNLMPNSIRYDVKVKCDWIYERIANAVYRVGFASKQSVYEKECNQLFEALDRLEIELLDGRSYLLGSEMLLCDVRLFVVLVRFDIVYYGHFKCNQRQIRDYPQLTAYMMRIYDHVWDTVDVDAIKTHYYQSHPWINPTQIVPVGPSHDFNRE